MDEELDRLVIAVRADTGGLSRDVAQMRQMLDGPLADGADRAGRAIETALVRAIRTGKFGFDDLRRSALAVMNEIAASAVRTGLGSLGGGGAGGLLSLATAVVPRLFGLPGRATGGPVSEGRPYLVGERGPELFVPTASGQVVANPTAARGPISITVNVAGPRDAGQPGMTRTGTQIARAVRRALADAEG